MRKREGEGKERRSSVSLPVPLLPTPNTFYAGENNFKVFRYSFSEAIPIVFNRLKSVFSFVQIAIKFSPVIGLGLKFVKMRF